MRFVFLALLVGAVSSRVVFAGPATPEPEQLGKWVDKEILRCDITIERRGKAFEEVWDNCSRKGAGETRNGLRQIGANRFKPSDPSRKGSWFYLIAPSGDLEVRDSEGVVRTIEMKGQKSDAQLRAQAKSQGVSIGMFAEQVRASSWGSPMKINRTVTPGRVREQWVYRGGYLYFDNGVLTAIQN